MIELSPLMGYIIEIIAAVLGAVVIYYIKRVADRIGFEIAERSFDTVENFVHTAVDWALSRYDHVDIGDNERIAEIAQWVVKRTPKAMKAAGFDAADVEDMVRELLKKRSG